MQVKVEHCCAGGETFYFRITPPNKRLILVSGQTWTRAIATYAKNELVRMGMKRENIRFLMR
jgi:hypothetical protein